MSKSRHISEERTLSTEGLYKLGLSIGDITSGPQRPLATKSDLAYNSNTVRDTLKLSTECPYKTLVKLSIRYVISGQGRPLLNDCVNLHQ